MATSTIKQVKNLGGSGYCKMPDGTLIQWGYASIPDNGDRVYVAYPITFGGIPTVAITIDENGYSGDVRLYSWQRLLAGLYALNRGVVQTKAVNFHWIAIGRWK